MKTNNQWRIETAGGGQIADTGDYSDPIYVLTNGTVELVTKDDIDEEEISHIQNSMNSINAKWEDWKLSDKEFELHLEQENCKKWKEIAKDLSFELRQAIRFLNLESTPNKSLDKYEELLKNLP